MLMVAPWNPENPGNPGNPDNRQTQYRRGSRTHERVASERAARRFSGFAHFAGFPASERATW